MKMSFRTIVAGLLGLVSAGPAWPGASLPPTVLPPAVQDFGAPSTCPIVGLLLGQSNQVGFDPTGDKTVDAGVYILNANATAADSTVPQVATAIVPAAFGTAPLNRSAAGVTSNPATAYNSSGVWLANDLKRFGMAANRDVILVPNFFPGQSINKWVGTMPGAMDTSTAYWQHLLGQLAVLQTATYGGGKSAAGCPISFIDWDQGEGDSSGTATGYNATATYGQGLAALIAAFKTLPGFNASATQVWAGSGHAEKQTVILLQGLATWPDNAANNARNDVIDTYRGGYKDPAVDVVPVDGLTGPACESLVNPGAHFSGICLQQLGFLKFSAYQHTRGGGNFGDRANGLTNYGSADAFPNTVVGPAPVSATCSVAPSTATPNAVMTCTGVSGAITVGSMIFGAGSAAPNNNGSVVLKQLTGTAGGAGTYQVSVSQTLASTALTFGLALNVADLRSGAVVQANGGSISMPPPNAMSTRPVEIEIYAAAQTQIDFQGQTGAAYNEQAGQSVSAFTVQGAATYRLRYLNGGWRIRQTYPMTGSVLRNTAAYTVSGQPAAPSGVSTQYAFYNGVCLPLTITPLPGMDLIVANAAAATCNSTVALNASYEANGYRILEPSGAVRQTGVLGGYAIPPGGIAHFVLDANKMVTVVTDTSYGGGYRTKARRILAKAASALPTTTAATLATLTQGANGAASTINGASVNLGAQTDSYVSARMSDVSGVWGIDPANPTYGYIGLNLSRSASAKGAVQGIGKRFFFDGQSFDICLYGMKTRLAATDLATGVRQWYSADQAAVANFTYLKVDFGFRAPRIVEVYHDATTSGWARGFNFAATDTIAPAPDPSETKLTVFGDSYTAGINNDNMRSVYAYILGNLIGAKNPILDGVSGTGYLGLSGQSWLARINQGDIDASKIGEQDLVLFWGSVNDNTGTDAAVQAAVTNTVAAAMAAQPKAIIMVAGPQFTSGAQTTAARYAAVQAGVVAAANGDPRVVYVDTSPYNAAAPGYRLQWGTGNVGGTTGNGNNDLYLASDGVHWTAAGNYYGGRRYAQIILSALRTLAQ